MTAALHVIMVKIPVAICRSTAGSKATYLQVCLTKVSQVYPVQQLFGVKRALHCAYRVSVVPLSCVHYQRHCTVRLISA